MINYFNMNNGIYFHKFSEIVTGARYLIATDLFSWGGEARKRYCKSTPKCMLIRVPRASFPLRAKKKGICNLVHFKAIWKKKNPSVDWVVPKKLFILLFKKL